MLQIIVRKAEEAFRGHITGDETTKVESLRGLCEAFEGTKDIEEHAYWTMDAEIVNGCILRKRDESVGFGGRQNGQAAPPHDYELEHW